MDKKLFFVIHLLIKLGMLALETVTVLKDMGIISSDDISKHTSSILTPLAISASACTVLSKVFYTLEHHTSVGGQGGNHLLHGISWCLALVFGSTVSHLGLSAGVSVSLFQSEVSGWFGLKASWCGVCVVNLGLLYRYFAHRHSTQYHLV